MKGEFEKKDLHMYARRVMGFRGFPPMFHKHVELIYVLSGEIKVNIDGCEKRLCAGEISIVFPYTIHAYENAPDAQAIILMFAPETIPTYEKILFTCKPQVPYCNAEDTLVSILLHITDMFAIKDKAHENIATAYLSGVVGELLQKLTLRTDCDSGTEVLQKLLTYCSTHFADESISIKTVSQALFISQSYISKIFSQKLGYSFREYINSLRVAEAKNLLKNTDLKITEIMLRCGFKNQSSFNRVFMEDCGITPRTFRAQTKKDSR